MAAPRKVSPEQEAAIIAWHSEYQRILNDLRKLGTYRDKAKEFGISIRSVHRAVDRDGEKARRCLGDVAEAVR